MRDTDPVIHAESQLPDGSIRLTLWVAADMPLFAGHFPSYPILPGVLQLQWVERLGRERFVIEGRFSRALNIKFQKPVLPDSFATLQLDYDAAKHQLAFSCRSEKGLHASGRLEFAA